MRTEWVDIGLSVFNLHILGNEVREKTEEEGGRKRTRRREGIGGRGIFTISVERILFMGAR